MLLMNGNTTGFLQIWFLLLFYFSCQIISSGFSLATSLTLQDALLRFRIKTFLSVDLLYPRQSNMPRVTREQLQGFLLCPEVILQRWNLTCANSSFPYASSPAMFFICDKLQTTDLPQISPCAYIHFIFC